MGITIKSFNTPSHSNVNKANERYVYLLLENITVYQMKIQGMA